MVCYKTGQKISGVQHFLAGKAFNKIKQATSISLLLFLRTTGKTLGGHEAKEIT